MWRILLFFTVIVITGCTTTNRSQMDRTTAPKAVFDAVWQWEGTDAPNDACIVSTPERYTLQFLRDGKVQVRFDCNNGGGPYVISAGKLSFSPFISTRRACERDSLDGRYVKDLQQVVAFFVQDDVLVLELSGEGGNMRFRRVDEQSQKKQEYQVDSVAEKM